MEMFIQMQSTGVTADLTVYNTTIHACAGVSAHTTLRPACCTPHTCFSGHRNPPRALVDQGISTRAAGERISVETFRCECYCAWRVVRVCD